MMSMSSVRGPQRSSRTRPWRFSIACVTRSSSRGESIVRARTIALR